MDKIQSMAGQFNQWVILYGPRIISAVLVLIVGLMVISWAGKLASKGMKRKNVDPSLQSFLASMVSVGLKVLLLITVAGMIGIQTTSFVAIIGALGLAVGLALQGSLANFAGGKFNVAVGGGKMFHSGFFRFFHQRMHGHAGQQVAH